jgi:hypothetical protein
MTLMRKALPALANAVLPATAAGQEETNEEVVLSMMGIVSVATAHGNLAG